MANKSRYIRLKSVKEFGYDIDFDSLMHKKVVIAGTGGIGSITAEIMTRCGVGVIILIDMDIIDEVNLNRLGFHPADIGKSKVDVCKRRLEKINPEVTVKAYHTDICEFKDFEKILETTDLLFMGLDNVAARQFVNIKCLKTQTSYVDVGASRSGLGGYVQMIIPGKTPCYQCTLGVNYSEKQERGEPCIASLPTTISILASLQSQIGLNSLLEFGSFPEYLTYNAITNCFHDFKVRKDSNCPVCSKKANIAKTDTTAMLKELEKEDLSKLINDLSAQEE